MTISVVLAASVRAQGLETAPPPDPAFGDTWVYRITDGYTGIETGRHQQEFLRRDVLTLAFRITDLKSNGARFVHLTHDLGGRQAQCGGPFSFPISVGKRHGYRLPFGVDGYEIPKCEVAAVEQVTVQAGKVKAFRVECSGNWLTQGTEGMDKVWQGRTNSTYWYAPAVNAPVRWLVRSMTPRASRRTACCASWCRSCPATSAATRCTRVTRPQWLRRCRVSSSSAAPSSQASSQQCRSASAPALGASPGPTATTTMGRSSTDCARVGRFTWANGQRYEGLWRGDRPEGHGKLTFANGNVYEGDVIDGVPEGRGTMTYASGDVYVGAVRAGVPHGEGTLNSKSGDRYIGAWKAGLKDGRGVLIWASGDRWEGAFVNDERTEGTLVRKAP